MPPKQKDDEYAFEYKAEEKPGLALTDLDASKWLNTRAYTEPAPTPRGEVGWICPVCGRGLAPSMSYCPCKLTREITYTSQGSTSTYTLDDVEEYDWVMTMPDDVSRSVD